MPADWDEIRSDYEKARDALRCPPGVEGWRRDEDLGRYYMWKAYHEASAAVEKNPSVYAGILMLMASESRFRTSDYDRYHRFVKPAREAYLLAEQAGCDFSKEEYERVRFEAESLEYELNREELPFEEQVAPIVGHEALEASGFSFHDSKPVRFEQFDESARLSLQYGDVVATFLFEGILDVHAEGDPRTNWIGDFVCYPGLHNRKILTFDVGYYRILCEKISVECERCGNTDKREKEKG